MFFGSNTWGSTFLSCLLILFFSWHKLIIVFRPDQRIQQGFMAAVVAHEQQRYRNLKDIRRPSRSLTKTLRPSKAIQPGFKQIKLVIIGDGGVGKVSYLLKHIHILLILRLLIFITRAVALLPILRMLFQESIYLLVWNLHRLMSFWME